MKYTLLLTRILENAETVKNAFHSDGLWPSHIAVAFMEFCATEYIGFSVSDESIYPNWYEEERLRLLDDKILKNFSYFRLRLTKMKREGLTEKPFDFALCEKIAALRDNDILSADLVFLCVLKELMQECRPVFRVSVSEDTIIPLLEYADANIYDYTAKSIEAVCKKLMEKANAAAAKRDWKPAAKFAEPEDLIQMVFKGIETKHSENITTIRIPQFFGNTNLTLSIHRIGCLYYIHDNKCTIRYLSRQLKDPKKYERAIKKVCNQCRIDNGRITGSFANVHGFMDYLRDLVFVAQAKLYYPRAKKQLCFKDKGYAYIPSDKAEFFDEASLINMLKEGVESYYDEEAGLCCWIKIYSSPFSTRFSFLIETLDDGSIRFSDRMKGKYEGELLEPCYWYHDDNDISVYTKFLSKLVTHFGGEFDGKDIYLSAKTKDFQSALFRFFQLAVLVSRFGHDIALPKISRKR